MECPHLVPELVFAILVITPHATVTSYLREKIKREKLKKKGKLVKSKSENPGKSETLIKCDPRCNCEVTSEVRTGSRQKIYTRRNMIEMIFQVRYRNETTL